MHYEKDQKGAAWLYQMFLLLHQVYFQQPQSCQRKGESIQKIGEIQNRKNIVDIMTSCLVSLFVKCCYSKKTKGLTDKNVIFSLVSQVPQATRRRGEDIPSTRARPTCSLCKQPMKGHKNVTDCPKKGAFPDEGTHILGNVFQGIVFTPKCVGNVFKNTFPEGIHFLLHQRTPGGQWGDYVLETFLGKSKFSEKYSS